MRVRVLAVVVLAGAVAGAVVLIADGGSSDGRAAEAAASTSTATASITRQNLVEVETEDGTLGYADTRSVVNRLRGTVTWLPPAGRVVRLDRTLYKVDDVPVVLMDGRVPAFRPLGPATPDGTDVRQLERSLRAAGYDPDREMAIDCAWSAGTTAAVRRWQQAHGLTRSGTVGLGRVVFLPGKRRIAATGAARGEPILTTTSTRQQVTVALDAARSALAEDGARIVVELPSDERVGGRITSVGKVATRSAPREEGASEDVTATIELKIRLSRAVTELDQAPVTVRLEKLRRDDALAIPVTALLARPGGRFAVQLVEAGRARRVVAVTPGVYAGGYVEIRGAGLHPGQRVTNAAVQ